MWIEIIGGICAFLVLIYLYFKKNFQYWTNQGVYQIGNVQFSNHFNTFNIDFSFTEPSFPVGSIPEFFTKSRSFNDVLLDHAKETKDLPYYGVYFLSSKVFMIKDPDLIRQITIKDFEYFVDRSGNDMSKRMFGNHKVDKIWQKQMSNAHGEEWKNIRSTFTPIFTAGSMKAMMVFIQDSCGKLISAMESFADKNEDFEAKECLGKFSMDTIASCAFGVDAQSFTNDKSLFVKYAQNIFHSDISQALKFMLCLLLPFGIGKKILGFMGKSAFFKVTETEFFYDVLVESLKVRKESKQRRNDLVDLMLDAIKGDLKADVDHNENQFEKDAKLKHSANKRNFDELEIVATAMVLLVAGYDTTGSTLAYCCYDLSKNPDVQDRLRAEVEDACDLDPDQDITYDQLQSMTYLDQVINETLRFHTPVGLLKRAATKRYQVPKTEVVIEKDMMAWINVIGVHMDPKHYESPQIYNPDHFSKEAKSKRHP